MIYIKELLPNPIGRDADGEWIKLVNTGEEPVRLTGWQIKDESGKKFTLSTEELSPQGELELAFGKTKIYLNNDRDTITLYDNESRQIDSLSYSSVTEGEPVVAEKFKKEIAIKEPLAASSESAFRDGIINHGYELWPILVGVAIALSAAALVVAASKKIFTQSV